MMRVSLTERKHRSIGLGADYRSDDGPGVPDAGSHGFGIGLANVRDRLEARFGDEASVVAGPVEGGYRSELRLPMVRHD